MSKKTEAKPKPNKVQELEAKCNEYLDGWKRAQADYQNLQKQVVKEKSQTIKFAQREIIEELLSVYDNFKMAVGHIPHHQEAEDWVIGIRHILKQLKSILENAAVHEILTVGEKFNPEVHEAVEQVATDEQHDGLVVEEVKPGYKMHGQVIQVAKVKVGVHKK
ncbi:MAG: nucleotide exchange factor GrpE [Candidatus Buchananbacteria bacterium CG10_big_fil_rev_8_21_14_0_10_42_9]|uniref:Protein GrpE n=1 Tax=Candidatus Buchananbacteria bacterium CG10_big_fil_rev_8_21_14_0_10_42_9 TaxID=1974526 RepID=A0A2H0W2J2_9BACT|nr:MAG: nucleotide exchange factor GrpE [Candidatus Buchananbacteria bacterium CG10_big_fil_rev_8_21_14_0_10_42_9]